MARLKSMAIMGQVEKPRDVAATERREGSEDPLILAVETSSRIGSVALASGPNLLAERSFSAPLRHSMEVLPSIKGLLERFGRGPQDIRQIHIDVGPGSFTGLRIAVAMAKAMNLAHGVEIVTVDTLDTIAANVSGDRDWGGPVERLAVVLDAKRDQFFAAVYERVAPAGQPRGLEAADDPGYQIPAPDCGIWRKIAPDCLISAADLTQQFARPDRPLCIAGDGLLYYRDAFAREGVRVLDESLWSPAASRLYALGYQKSQARRMADPLTVVPFYLRGPDVTLKKS
jgi:tRNA threonylcarbamoyl adenosine modification protein YeaZ